MLIVTIYGGLVSQIRAFYLAYRLTYEKNDKLVLDLSQYYNGYYQQYLLDYFNIPEVDRVCLKGNEDKRISQIIAIYRQTDIKRVRNGEELESIYREYDLSKIYYITNDCCEYDSFCYTHREFFFRYTGDDLVASKLVSMFQLQESSLKISFFEGLIANCNSVGIHIRLRDFVKVGWMVEQDYDFYRAAVQWFRENTSNPVFFVFSDDIDFAKKILGNCKDVKYVKLCGGYIVDAEELLCLAMCEHRILTKKSNYGLFATMLARKQYHVQGYNLIIEKMNLADFAGARRYIEDNYNNNCGCHKNEDLGKYVSLSEKEIANYSRKFQINKVTPSDRMPVIFPDVFFDNYEKTEQELWEEYKNKYNIQNNDIWCLENKRIIENKFNKYSVKEHQCAFLFVTLQTYSEVELSGMSHMAFFLAQLGYEVHFVGRRYKYSARQSDVVKWTKNNAVPAQDLNSLFYGFLNYPYAGLNAENKYLEFIHDMQDEVEKELIVITRKPSALPIKVENRKGKYVFIDFSDPCEKESHDYSNKEIEYMYCNADIVITFDFSVYKEWEKKLENICYIDIEKYYPQYVLMNEKVQSPIDLKKYEEECFRAIYNAVIN